VIEDRLARLYETVRESLSGDRRGQRTLHDLEGRPADIRWQGRPDLALLEDLSQEPPWRTR
jgi:hypothetical protein